MGQEIHNSNNFNCCYLLGRLKEETEVCGRGSCECELIVNKAEEEDEGLSGQVLIHD